MSASSAISLATHTSTYYATKEAVYIILREKVQNLTAGEPFDAVSSSWDTEAAIRTELGSGYLRL